MDTPVSSATLPSVVLIGLPVFLGVAVLVLIVLSRQRGTFAEKGKNEGFLRFLSPILIAGIAASIAIGLLFGLAASGVEREEVSLRTNQSLDCIFVFDLSGSMAGARLQRELMLKVEKYVAEHAGDARCSTVAFGDAAVEVVANTFEHFLIADGIALAQDQVGGGTNISAGILAARNVWQRSGSRPSVQIFLISDLADGRSGEYVAPARALLSEGATVTIVWFSASTRSNANISSQVIQLRASGATIVQVENEDDISQIPLSVASSINEEERIAPDLSGHVPPGLVMAFGLVLFVLSVALFPWIRWR